MKHDYTTTLKSCQTIKLIKLLTMIFTRSIVSVLGGYMDIHRFMRIITNERLQKKFTQKFYYVVKWFTVIFWGYFIWRII